MFSYFFMTGYDPTKSLNVRRHACLSEGLCTLTQGHAFDESPSLPLSPSICPQMPVNSLPPHCSNSFHSSGVDEAAAAEGGVLVCVEIGSALGGNNRWAGSSGIKGRTDTRVIHSHEARAP